MLQDAVVLALSFDMSLASATANRPEEEPALKRSLWLTIARHIVHQHPSQDQVTPRPSLYSLCLTSCHASSLCSVRPWFLFPCWHHMSQLRHRLTGLLNWPPTAHCSVLNLLLPSSAVTATIVGIKCRVICVMLLMLLPFLCTPCMPLALRLPHAALHTLHHIAQVAIFTQPSYALLLVLQTLTHHLYDFVVMLSDAGGSNQLLNMLCYARGGHQTPKLLCVVVRCCCVNLLCEVV